MSLLQYNMDINLSTSMTMMKRYTILSKIPEYQDCQTVSQHLQNQPFTKPNSTSSKFFSALQITI